MTTNMSPEAGVGEPADLKDRGAPEREFTIRARTQRQLVTRRFLRHRGALAGMTFLLAVIVLAFTSIGIGPVPGWWSKDFTSLYPTVDGGRPTAGLPFFGGLGWGEHPFGQDTIGRDYFALTMRGTQVSLVIAFTVGITSTIIGAFIGAIAGYYRGWLESALMRFTDVVIAVPLLVIAAVIARRFGDQGIVVLALVLATLTWTGLARLVRGEFLSLREKEFVEAARAMGAGGGRIIGRHILPNTVGVIIVSATLLISSAILLETALSYLGFGVQAPDTSLGVLISNYQTAFQTRPWLFWFPGLFIITVALSVNFIGDGLRDAFDPRQQRVRA